MPSPLGKHQRASSDPTAIQRAKKPTPAPLQPYSSTRAEPADTSIPIKAEAADDAHTQIVSTGSLFIAGHEFASQPLVLCVGEGRTRFFVHKHLIPSEVIRAMRPSQSGRNTEIQLAEEEPDVVGLMIRWCYRAELPTVTMPFVTSVPRLGGSLPTAFGPSMPEKDPKESSPIQFTTLRIYFEGYNSGGVQKIVSFEEKRLDDYEKDLDMFSVYETVVRHRALDSDGQKMKPNVNTIRTYLQDVKGIPMFGTSDARVEAELVQLKLVRLSRMAATYGWLRLLDATLFAYSKGEILLSRRHPVLHHIELAYSGSKGSSRLRVFMASYALATTQAHNTRAALIHLFTKCPKFLHDFMAQQDNTHVGGFEPLSWYAAHYCSDGTERPLTG
ncbi:hypothetical protein LZ30DRAFT_693239 [Colletotrichum cereale]|nr:hypothetical protein LZ30DRAFT_693239 [Colletotrichum cereale]